MRVGPLQEEESAGSCLCSGLQCWQEARAEDPNLGFMGAVGEVTGKDELTGGSCRNSGEQNQDALQQSSWDGESETEPRNSTLLMRIQGTLSPGADVRIWNVSGTLLPVG